MKQKLKTVGVILLAVSPMLLAVGLVSYPFISTAMNDNNQATHVYELNHTVVNTDTETLQSMLADAAAYNSSMEQHVQVEEFSSVVEDDQYMQLLDFGNELMGSLEIPTIDVTLPIYHSTTDEVMSKGAGHLYGSSLPVGGDSTHSILVSHSGLANATLFTNLDEVKRGDRFYINICGERHVYTVDLISTVLPGDISTLGITAGEDYVTLVTCTPVTVNTHRLLVRGVRTPNEESITDIAATGEIPISIASATPEDSLSKRRLNQRLILLAIGIAVMLVSSILAMGFADRKKER